MYASNSTDFLMALIVVLGSAIGCMSIQEWVSTHFNAVVGWLVVILFIVIFGGAGWFIMNVLPKLI